MLFEIELSNVGTLETRPRQLRRGRQVDFKLKRLIHESVPSIEDLIPYYKSQLYQRDEYGRGNDTDSDDDDDRKSQDRQRKYGWFPIDWVYAEVEFEDELNEQAKAMFDSFHMPRQQQQQAANRSASYEDELYASSQDKYNPYWMMRFPRVPLFVIRMRLPLDAMSRFVNEIEEKSGEELYNTRQTRMSYPYANDAVTTAGPSGQGTPGQLGVPYGAHGHGHGHSHGHGHGQSYNNMQHLSQYATQQMYYDTTNQSTPYTGVSGHTTPNVAPHQNQNQNQVNPGNQTVTTMQSSIGPYAEYGFGAARMEHIQHMKHDPRAHGQYGTQYSSREASQDYFTNAQRGHVPKQSAANIRYRNNSDDDDDNGNGDPNGANNHNGQNGHQGHEHPPPHARYPSQGNYAANNNENVDLDEETSQQLQEYYHNDYQHQHQQQHHSNRHQHHESRSNRNNAEIVYDDERYNNNNSGRRSHRRGNSAEDDPDIVYQD